MKEWQFGFFKAKFITFGVLVNTIFDQVFANNNVLVVKSEKSKESGLLLCLTLALLTFLSNGFGFFVHLANLATLEG